MGSIMKKDFVPYDIAVELNNLGFDEECYGHSYTEMEEDFHLDMLPLMKNSRWESVGAISIPMYHQVFSWLRDEHNYYAILFPIEISTSGKDGHRFCYEAYNMKDQDFYITGMNSLTNPFGFLTYEETELECLKKLIQIVKDKKDAR